MDSYTEEEFCARKCSMNRGERAGNADKKENEPTLKGSIRRGRESVTDVKKGCCIRGRHCMDWENWEI